eukprot:TRINITY_DN2361_c0_g1_i3.p6 TRINITY_DN2361_c0_g1~~TRINITY_DN2361_c0_g1_i3.p6  ORF type:complete len:106 (-),score=1.87 TRINITY_DN2361_c0_g1_i3:60-377(-)
MIVIQRQKNVVLLLILRSTTLAIFFIERFSSYLLSKMFPKSFDFRNRQPVQKFQRKYVRASEWMMPMLQINFNILSFKWIILQMKQNNKIINNKCNGERKPQFLN